MNTEQFENISKAKVSLFASLAKKKNRKETGLFVIEGSKSVLDSLSRFKVSALIATDEWLTAHEIVDKNISIYKASATQLRQISSLSTPPDVISVCFIPRQPELPENLCQKLTLLLDGIQDPGNLGTIIRIADWFGIDAIIASHDTVDIYNTKTVQATMGSIGRVPVFYENLADVIKNNPDVPVYGTLLDGKNIYKTHLSSNGFIIMGNEGNGISREIRELINHPILIPPFPADAPTAESLNVSIATAITIAEFRRRQEFPL